MKVLLVSANAETRPYPVYPLGIDYVAGALADRHDLAVVDINDLGHEAELENRVRIFSPDVIGVSIRNVDNTDEKTPLSYIDRYQSIIRRIREVTPAPLILGGSGFTLFPAQMLASLQADYGIIGEGERFGTFLDVLEQGGDVSRLEGVVLPGGSPLTATPPPWDGGLKRLFDPANSHVAYYLKKGGMLNLQTKRGCPFRCIYCTYPNIEGRRLRRYPPRLVAETALKLQDAGAKYLFITDSVFNSDCEHSREVARSFQKAGLGIPWGAYIAPVRPPADYYKILAEAGMTHVEFGTESLSDTILKNYRKPFRTADIFPAHRAAVEAGLHTAHFFLPGAPAETPHTLAETLDNAESLERTVCFFFAGIRIYPNTGLYEMALASGQITPAQDLLRPCFFRPEGIGLETINEMIVDRSQGRHNWILGAGGQDMAKVISRLHARGHAGPLWEHLIQ